MPNETVQWVTFILNNSLSVVIVSLLIGFFVKYGPSLVNAHLAFVAAAQSTLESLPEIDRNRLLKLDTLSREHNEHFTETQKTNHALSKACDLIDVYATDAPNAGEIRQHIVEIRKALHG